MRNDNGDKIIESLREINYCRGENCILKNISLSIHRGEYIVIRGRSGVGKTTLTRIIALLDKPTSGSIIFLGRDVTDMPDHYVSGLRLRYIGYIDQHYTLFNELTILDNILLPLKLMGRIDRGVIDYAGYLLDEFGLHGKMHKYPGELSGGERQRVAIIRALIKKPLLVIGDEPFSNLDEDTKHIVEELLYSFVREEGLSVIIATTDLYSKYMCDREYLLRNGILESIK